jgi:hypothetical protein
VQTDAQGNKIVKFNSAGQMALHLVSTMGMNGILPAATAIALEQLENRGLTIEQMCPAEVSAYRQSKEKVFSTLCPMTPTPGGPSQGGTGNTPNPTPIGGGGPPGTTPTGPINNPTPTQPINIGGPTASTGPADAGADGFTPQKVDCYDKTNGWYCMHSYPGVMVLCQNTLSTKGCVCAACGAGQGGTPASCACPY